MSTGENIVETIIYKKNNDEVKIIDHFFSEEVLEKIVDYFKKIEWKCQCNKDRNVTNESGDSPYWRIELENETFFNSYLKNIIEQYLNKHLQLNRIYVVGQTYGQDSIFHIDDKKVNTFTCCFYINDEYIDDSGSFYLKIPNEKFIISIKPILNRIIIFPSRYRHKGSGLSRFNNNLRLCIAWKFEILL